MFLQFLQRLKLAFQTDDDEYVAKKAMNAVKMNIEMHQKRVGMLQKRSSRDDIDFHYRQVRTVICLPSSSLHHHHRIRRRLISPPIRRSSRRALLTAIARRRIAGSLICCPICRRRQSRALCRRDVNCTSRKMTLHWNSSVHVKSNSAKWPNESQRRKTMHAPGCLAQGYAYINCAVSLPSNAL